MELVQEYLPLVCQLLVGLSVVATLVARLTPSSKDDVLVEGAKNKLLKVLAWLPTFGVNPRTKALEDALKALSVEVPKV